MSRIFLLVAGGLSLGLAGVFPCRASQINWGNALSSADVNFASAGDPLDVAFTFALGTFGGSFVPGTDNIALWAANWKELDLADYNPLFDYFTSETDLPNNSIFEAGEAAYIWIYDTQAAESDSEWLLMRGSTWEVPLVTGAPTFPLQWRVSGAEQLLFGGKDGIQGPGGFTATPVNFRLQTHTPELIPEPSAALLGGLIAGVMALRRRRLALGGRCAGLAVRGLVAPGLVLVANSASAAPFTYEAIPASAIPDNDATGISETITVSEHFIINDLNIGINASHPHRGEISLRLTSPSGTTVVLIGTGADTADSYDLLLDSGSGSAIDDSDADDTATPYYDRTADAQDSLGLFDGEDASGTWTITVVDLSAGNSGTLNRFELAFDSITFEIPPALAVGNLVFLDVGGDGHYDPGIDPPADRVRVQLFAADEVEIPTGPDGILGTSDDAPGGMLTHDGGCYMFGELPEGSYYVKIPASEFAPGGSLCGLFSSPPETSDDGIDDDTDENGLNDPAPQVNGIRSSTFILAADAEPVGEAGRATAQSDDANTNLTVDFGFVQPAHLGSLVWFDEDGDGRKDAGERGLGNVTILLCSTDGVTLASTLTDAWGGYGFDVAPGTYRIKVEETTLPPGFTQTSVSPEVGSDLVNQNQNGGLGYEVAVPPGRENLTADFGYNINPTNDVDGGANAAALGDRVWIDADGDGRQTPEEPGLPDVIVRLYVAGPDGLLGTADDEVLATASTDALGYYLFPGLPPEGFVVKIDPASLPPGSVQTGDPDHPGAAGGSNDHSTTTPVVLAPGDVFLNADFGYRPPAYSDNAVGGVVWFDAGADGTRDAMDFGVARVTVTLIKDLSGDGGFQQGEPIIAATMTDADGHYVFPGLPDGTYLIWVNDTDSVLPGLRQTYDTDGLASANLSAVDLDAAGVLGSPVTDPLQGFGYAPANQNTGQGLIGDTVWLDLSLDGIFDPDEFPIEGILVRLCTAGNDLVFGTADDILAAVTTTDENGHYAFGGLSAGTYQIKVTPLGGLTPTADADGLGTPNQSIFTLTPAAPVNLDQDFGYRATTAGTIGNLVFLDSNADGISDPDGADNLLGTDDDEPGLGGITLDLFMDHDGDQRLGPGDSLFSQATTDALGEYLFTGLPVGQRYLVDVTDRAGRLLGHWHSRSTSGAADASKTDPSGAELTIAAPDAGMMDFGYYLEPAALGNYVWFDQAATGSQPPEEAGLADVLVSLTIEYPNGAATILKTKTDGAGFYSFGNLLLDEDHRSGTTGTPAVEGLPRFTLSVTPGQASLDGLKPTLIDRVGVDDTLDSDDPAGVVASPIQGRTDVRRQLPASAEQAIASYDFGYRTLQPLTYGAFVASNGLQGVDAQPVPDENGVGGNPDGDSFSNLFEYVIASPPTSGANGLCPAEIVIDPVNDSIDLCLHRVVGQVDVSAALEAAGSLGSPTGWQEAVLPSVVTPNGDGTETVCYRNLESLGAEFTDGDGFVRVRIDLYLPEDPAPIATTYSPVFGWIRPPHGGPGSGAGLQLTTFSMPFLKCEVLGATVTDNSETALDLSVSIGSGSVAEALDAESRYFVESVSGPCAGSRFEVDVAASTRASLAIVPASPNNTKVLTAGLLAGAGVVVREHWSLATLFPPSVFLAGSEPTNSDSVLTHGAGGWSTFWLADLGGGAARWVEGGDAGLADQGGRSIASAEGVFVQHCGSAIELVRAGTVRENALACPLRVGCTLVGSGYPVDQSFDTRAMGLATGFVGSNDLPAADQVHFWLGDTVPGGNSYNTDFLIDVGPPYQYWASAADSSVTNLNGLMVFDATGAAIYCSQHGLPTYFIPAPWSP